MASLGEMLLELSDDLDKIGAFKYADKIDSFIKKEGQAQFYYAEQDLVDKPERILTKNIDFLWGGYPEGQKYSNDYYMIGAGHNSLGPVQFPGDPFTYAEEENGMLRVVSGPSSERGAVGGKIKDPRASEMQAKVEVREPEKELGDSDKQILVERLKDSKKRFSKAMSAIADEIDKRTLMGIEGEIVRRMSDRLRAPGLTFEDAERLWIAIENNLRAVTSNDNFNLLKENFLARLENHKETRNSILMQYKGAEEESELNIKVASDDDKKFDLKELRYMFWHGSNSPFGR